MYLCTENKVTWHFLYSLLQYYSEIIILNEQDIIYSVPFWDVNKDFMLCAVKLDNYM